mmetsp:Transcript_15614/g.26559  ORF Transcript_15614/g.26559 Transcript_15614/m.26559 type:complete len:287 (-) Transcript_15614:68-928(-)
MLHSRIVRHLPLHEGLNDLHDLFETQATRQIFVVGIEDLLRLNDLLQRHVHVTSQFVQLPQRYGLRFVANRVHRAGQRIALSPSEDLLKVRFQAPRKFRIQGGGHGQTRLPGLGAASCPQTPRTDRVLHWYFIFRFAFWWLYWQPGFELGDQPWLPRQGPAHRCFGGFCHRGCHGSPWIADGAACTLWPLVPGPLLEARRIPGTWIWPTTSTPGCIRQTWRRQHAFEHLQMTTPSRSLLSRIASDGLSLWKGLRGFRRLQPVADRLHFGRAGSGPKRLLAGLLTPS